MRYTFFIFGLFFCIINIKSQTPVYGELNDASYFMGVSSLMDKKLIEFNTISSFQNNNDFAIYNQRFSMSRKLGSYSSSRSVIGMLLEGQKMNRNNHKEKIGIVYQYNLALERNFGLHFGSSISYLFLQDEFHNFTNANNLSSPVLISSPLIARNNYTSFDVGMLLYVRHLLVSLNFSNINTPVEAKVKSKSMSLPIRTKLKASYLFKGDKISVKPIFSYEYSKGKALEDSLFTGFFPSSNNGQLNIQVKYNSWTIGIGSRNVINAYKNINMTLGVESEKFKLFYNLGVAKRKGDFTTFNQLNLSYSIFAPTDPMLIHVTPEF